MLTLHHLENSRSQRILWLLEELNVDYEICEYKRDPKTRLAPPELGQIHPLGKSPVITDGDLTIAESAVIIEYIARSYGGDHLLFGLDDERYWDCQYWMHFAEGSLMPPLVQRLVFEVIRTSPMPFFAKPIANEISRKVMKNFVRPNIQRSFTMIDNHLATNSFFVGQRLTVADFQMSFPLEASVARNVVGHDFPNIKKYVERYKATDSYQRALVRGGEYDYA